LLVLSSLIVTRRATAAEEPSVPSWMQSDLLSKLVPYDRNFESRANGRVQTLILTKRGRLDSGRVADQLQAAFAHIDEVGKLPHEERIFEYSGPESLIAACKSSRASIVYVTPGFRDDVPVLRAAFTGANVLSVAAVPEYVERGIVLGFDLVSSKPKMLLHLSQARAQQVAFKSDVLRLMRVYP